MNHAMYLKDSNLQVKPRRIKRKQKFLDQLSTKLRQVEASEQVYENSNISACAMFIIPEIDEPDEGRFLHDLVVRNGYTIMEPPDIPDQASIINTIARYVFRSTIDLRHRYYNIRIQSSHENHSASVTLSGTYSTRIMQQGDSNCVTILQKIMNNLFSNQTQIIISVYIDDMCIFNSTYKEDLAHVRTVIQSVTDHKFLACSGKSQFLAYRGKSQFLPDVLSI